MQKRNAELNSDGGSALVITLVFSVVFTLLGLSVITIVNNGSSMLRRDIEMTRVYWTNESALNIACRYASLNYSMPDGMDIPIWSGSFMFSAPFVLNHYNPAFSAVSATGKVSSQLSLTDVPGPVIRKSEVSGIQLGGIIPFPHFGDSVKFAASVWSDSLK
jgi:hypothetical protein